MLVKMKPTATPREVAAVEDMLHALGFKTGKMVGEQITLI
ncbi:MAG: 3-deoxy-7-phosphoheptulonate synthase, partial [Deltaproteobacteria bacterium]